VKPPGRAGGRHHAGRTALHRGAWRPPVSGETHATINPATEEESARIAKGDERDIDLAVQVARKAFDSGRWPKMSADDRGRIVWKLGDLIVANLDEMARLESLCTGKTLFDSGKVEIPFAAEIFRYYAGWATKIRRNPGPARGRLHLHASPARRGGGSHRPLECPVPARLVEDRPGAGSGQHGRAETGLADLTDGLSFDQLVLPEEHRS